MIEQEAGLSIGGKTFNQYVMLEVHYNNPEKDKGTLNIEYNAYECTYNHLNYLLKHPFECYDFFSTKV